MSMDLTRAFEEQVPGPAGLGTTHGNGMRAL